MSKTTTVSRTRLVGLAVGMLMVGVLAGVVGAQIAGNSRFVQTGLFTVGQGEGVAFHVTLDDGRTGSPANVALRLLNQAGQVVARQDAVLEPGQSATLRFRTPGVYRAFAQAVEPEAPLSARRVVVGTVEIFDLEEDVQARSLALAGRTRFVCSQQDGSGSSRIPD
jgi:hypothetical protein